MYTCTYPQGCIASRRKLSNAIFKFKNTFHKKYLHMLAQKSSQLELFNFSSSKFLSNNAKFQFIDLFAGIGGFRIPLEELGGRCLGHSEIDKEAGKVYKNNFVKNDDHGETALGDITKIDELPPNIDLIVGGVPCQPWSVAGKLRGFEDPRGQLWFDVIRLVRKSKPKAFIFENVKGLSNPKNLENLKYLLGEFESMNYQVQHKVVNSYDFGVPQSRERVFIVGIRNDLENCSEYHFPEPIDYKPRLLDIIEVKNCVPINKVKISQEILFGGQIPPSRNRFQKDDELNDFFVFSDLRNGHTTIHSWDLIETTEKEKNICLALLRNRRRKKYGPKDGNPLSFQDFSELIEDIEEKDISNLVKKKIIREIDHPNCYKYDFVNSKNSSGINGIYRVFLPNSEMIPTLTATGAKDYIATKILSADNPEEYRRLFIQQIYKPNNFRLVTAQDACRLQGFPEWFEFHENENIAKRQFGNAVSVPVVYHIAQNLLKTINLV
jgi:DNA (cytosine-5)-methyltransferase 1